RHQAGIPFDADDAPRAPRQGKREVTETTVQVEHARLRAELQQLRRRRHQLAIDTGIDLNEVGRQKLDLQVCLWQRIEEALRRLAERDDAVDAARLQIQAHAMHCLELAQPR